MKALIGIKKKMTQIFNDEGIVVPVTLIMVKDVIIAARKSKEKDGYEALVLGMGKKKHGTKAELGKYKSLGYVPEFVRETKINGAEEISKLDVGTKLAPDIFTVNDKVDVVGVSKGKGFQGVVKRWHFKGGPHTHGQSDRERHPGSIGQRMTPGRVFKGKKMGGRMGGDVKTVKNLRIVIVDKEQGLLGIKGAIPGNRGSFVMIISK